jgi:predicted AAA+ superfamily ATPase
MIKRALKKDILMYIKHFPSILITGARQVGKSTLAMDLGIDNYVTFDDITTYESAKADPKSFIMSLKKPVVIDEVQKVPEIFVAIKEHIDNDRTAGTFILTGSSNLQGFKEISDSLAGRIGIIDLYPFNLAECYEKDTNLIDLLLADQLPSEIKEIDFPKHVIKGGFPEVQTINEQKILYLWFSSYISTYIERDARDLGDIRNLDSFMRLYKSLAFRSANLTNKADISKETGIDNKTLDNYLSLLKNTYQIDFLTPYFRNELKRLTKTPKVYLLDTGILCHLLRISETDLLMNSEYKGMLYESFVYSELLKANTYAKNKVEISFYRTSDGKEIDFILDNGRSLTAIEIKSAKTVTMSDFKHIKYFAESTKGLLKTGYVMYNGNKVLSFGEHTGTKLYAVPIYLGT